jgi:hypothetical protein
VAKDGHGSDKTEGSATYHARYNLLRTVRTKIKTRKTCVRKLLIRTRYYFPGASTLRRTSMFRASPWVTYDPSADHRNQNPARSTPPPPPKPTDDTANMDAPHISTLREEESPPPPAPNPSRTSKFRVKLLVNDGKRRSDSVPSVRKRSQAPEDDEEQDEEEEDQLIDDEDVRTKSASSIAVAASSSSTASRQADSAPKRKPKKKAKEDNKKASPSVSKEY